MIIYHTGDEDKTAPGTNFRADFLEIQGSTHTHHESGGFGIIPRRDVSIFTDASLDDLPTFLTVENLGFEIGSRGCVITLAT